MADLALVLFSLAVGSLIGFCIANRRHAPSPHRPQRTPRYPWS